MTGALIPEGYELDYHFRKKAWICPVRTCRLVTARPSALGNHFCVRSGRRTVSIQNSLVLTDLIANSY
jgi:hypothetical protein